MGQGSGAGRGASTWGKGNPNRVGLRSDGRPWGAGCGDQSTDSMVPDLFPKACEKHDKCYEQCPSRRKCDADFYNNMITERPDLYLGAPGIPALYWFAVRRGGADAYRRANPNGDAR